MHSSSSLVLPSPALPSTTTTQPVPARTWLSLRRITASSCSRPRRGGRNGASIFQRVLGGSIRPLNAMAARPWYGHRAGDPGSGRSFRSSKAPSTPSAVPEQFPPMPPGSNSSRFPPRTNTFETPGSIPRSATIGVITDAAAKWIERQLTRTVGCAPSGTRPLTSHCAIQGRALPQFTFAGESLRDPGPDMASLSGPRGTRIPSRRGALGPRWIARHSPTDQFP